MVERRWVQQHIECPCGESSDAYSTRTDGSGFCFSCSKNFSPHEFSGGSKTNKIEEDVGEVTYSFRGNWSIPTRVYEFYRVETKFVNSLPVSEAYPYADDALKVRDLTRDKSQGENVFRTVGPIASAGLFGSRLFDRGSKDAVIICEGEKDAMSAYEMLQHKFASVSVQSSSSAKRDCTKDYDWLNSFSKIYICMDNDKAGREAVAKLQGLFDFRKVYHVRLDRHKDANEYLVAGEAFDFARTVSSAKRFAPDNIISAFSDIEKALDVSAEDQLGTYPFSGVDSNLYGLHAGEVIVIKAQEGVGKTEFLRALEHHLLKTTKHPIGIIHLEEDNATTVKAIAGYELQLPAVLPDCGLSKQDILAGYKRAVRDDEGRVHIHSSFDVEDEEAFLGNIRFLVSAAGCRFIFLDHISWLATGLADEDERKKLDRLSQKLKLLAKELRFCLVEISHVNDDGKTRGSRNISKVANTVIDLSREVAEGHNTVSIRIEKARLGGRTGPAGKAMFDRETGTLKEWEIDV